MALTCGAADCLLQTTADSLLPTEVRRARFGPGLWPVSLLSDADVPIEHISHLVGHSSTTTTETTYRKQIRPVIVHGADIMDRIFPGEVDHHV